MPILTLWRRAVLALVVVVGCTALSACQVRLISLYDAHTDAAATHLQKELEGFILHMVELSQSQAADDVAQRTYDANRAFYRNVQVEISSMLLRANAIPQNERTFEQIELLSQSVEALRQLHIAGGAQGLRPVVAEPARIGINTHLGAIIKLELAKQRGSE